MKGWPLSADDWAELVEKLDLKDAIHVGHSSGGGEVARYLGRHGAKRAAMAVLIGAVPPLMLKTAANPGGLPIEAFDQIRAAALNDQAQKSRKVARFVLDARDDRWTQGCLRLHQGFFRDGFHRRS